MTCLLTLLLSILSLLIVVGLWVCVGRERSPVSRDFVWVGRPLRYIEHDPSEFSHDWEGRS